jgi:integrase
LQAIQRLLDLRCEFEFSYADGSRPHCDSFLPSVKAAAKRCGILKRIDIHTLRHSYGSNKIRRGWGVKKVSKLLGHAKFEITAQIYTHLLDGDLKVRDEFRFDNDAAIENSWRAEVRSATNVRASAGSNYCFERKCAE